MGIQEQLVSALRQSPAWDSSAYIITYDEHGGYFEHVPPPQVDAFGLGSGSRRGSSRRGPSRATSSRPRTT